MTAAIDRSPASRWRPAPLLPREDGRDRSLVFVVGVLAFLACLTAIAALAADRAAQGWRIELSGEATVQVRPRAGETPAESAARAAEILSSLPGVTEAVAMEPAQARALLEPWFGRENIGADWPIPQLVTVELDRERPANARTLQTALTRGGVDAAVDDHSRWRGDIERAGLIARTAAAIGFLLIGFAAAAVVSFATKAGLAARRDVVEVLHLSGAKDSFIAQLFQSRFAALAGMAGLYGAVAAAAVAASARMVGGGEGFSPVLPIAWVDLLIVIPVPLIAALISAWSARLTAEGILKTVA